jgi:hypothetical protein
MTNPKVAALQSWLNLKGMKPQLTVDGKGGPATRAALLAMFINRQAPAVTTDELETFADRLGVTLRQLQAVAQVESGGGGFGTDGRPRILWERHYFWKRLRLKIPLVSDPVPGGYTLDANRNGINDSWEKLAEGACHAPASAFESASWGKFQIMGAWWQKLGYDSAADFAWSLRESEAAHYEALVRYVERFGLVAAMRAIDGNPMNARPFARGYNGPGFAKFSYDSKIAAAWRALA